MAERSPAFQFYPKDFLVDERVATMSLQEVGAYILLLCHSWIERGIPSDQATLARLCRVPATAFARLWPRLGPLFTASESEPGRLFNRRMEEERGKQEAYRRGQSESGRVGADRRWHTDRLPIGSPQGAHGVAIDSPIAENGSPSPSPSSTKKEESPLPPYPDFDFDVWLDSLRERHPGNKGTRGSCKVNAQLVLQGCPDIPNTAATISANQVLWAESWNGTQAKYIPALPNWLVRVDAGGRSFPCLELPPKSTQQIDTDRIVEELCKRVKKI